MVLRAGLEPARIAPHAPQTCAATNYATSADFQKNYYLFAVLFVLALLAFVAVFAFVLTIGIAVLTVVFPVTALELTVMFGSSAEFVATVLTGEFELSAVAAGAVSVGVAVLVCKTETFPVRAGIERNKAESIKTTAATILIFARTVCVPRWLKAELEILLVNNAPASVLPGCNKTDAIKTMQAIKNNAYKK